MLRAPRRGLGAGLGIIGARSIDSGWTEPFVDVCKRSMKRPVSQTHYTRLLAPCKRFSQSSWDADSGCRLGARDPLYKHPDRYDVLFVPFRGRATRTRLVGRGP